MRLLGSIASFFAGFVVEFLLGFGFYLAWLALGGVDPEGALGMGTFFFYGSILGLVLAAGFSTLAWRRLSPGTRRDMPPQRKASDKVRP